MTATQKRISIIVGVVALMAVGASTPVLRRNSPAFNFFFSPSDLYVPLGTTDLDLSHENRSYTFHFESKYPGLHWIAIEVERPSPTPEAYSGSFILDLQISANNAILRKETINGPGSPFWGGADRSGFALYWYRSPGDLPLREPLSAMITIVRGDSGFNTKYGKSKIVVRKLSDE